MIWVRGRRVPRLRLGVKGAHVLTLQQQLAQKGYNPGPADGVFGYLTQDAVLLFQADYGLRVDGVVGANVWELLTLCEKAPMPQVYVLGAGESISDAARALGTNKEALRRMNRLSVKAKGYPGQRLVCRRRYVLATLGVNWRSTHLRLLTKWADNISAIAIPASILGTKDAVLHPLSDEVAALAKQAGWQMWLTLYAESTKTEAGVSFWRSAQATVQAAVELAKEYRAGLWIDIRTLCWGEGPRLLGLVRKVRTALVSVKCPVMVSLPLPPSGARWRQWLTDLDYPGFAAAANRLVLTEQRANPPSSYASERQRYQEVIRQTAAWRTMLNVDLEAEERDANGCLQATIPYSVALTRAYTQRKRPEWESERCLLKATLDDHVLWIPNRQTARIRLDTVNRLGMAGVVLGPVGDGDQRIWSLISSHFPTFRGIVQNESDRPGI